MRRKLPIILAAALLLPLLAWAAITASFTMLSPGGTPPPARRSAGLALEERGGGVDRLHLYGGYNGTILGTQFFYDSGTGNWTPVTPAVSPGVRERHGLGWDSARSRLVLFGGGIPNGFRNTTRSDVWIYAETTNTWSALTNSTSVTARVDPLMVYVSHQAKFFVFGGLAAYGFQATLSWLNDAWWLDADPAGTATWTPIVASGGPPVSGAHCAAYDFHRKKVVLFGGETTGSALLSDTRQYDVDANTWSNDPATGDIPSPRAFCQTSYDPVLRRVVLYGGQDASGNPVGGLYLYDPVTFIWTQVTPTNPPGTVSDSTLVYSPGAQTHFLYGGRVSTSGYDGRTFRLDLVSDTGGTPPTANAGADFNTNEDVSTQLNGSGTSPGTLTYQWTQLAGPVVTLSDPNLPSPTFQSPRVTASTPLTFSLEVDDGTLTATDSVTVTVLDSINEAPTAAAGTDASVGEGAPVTLTGSGTDPNGEALSYAWIQLSGPAVTLTGAGTATPGFTSPSVVTTRSLLFQLTVTDARGGADTDQVEVQVQDNINEPPTVSAGTDASVDEGAGVSLTASASDPNAESLGYLWEQTSGPAVSLTTPTAATAGFTAPPVLTPQVLVFRVTVSDPRGGTANDSLSVTVQDAVNEPPTAVAGVDSNVGESEPVSLTGSGTDPNGDALSYAWTQLSGPVVSLAGASSAAADFTSPSVVSPTALVFELTVTDARGGTAVDQVTVRVDDDVNELPVASAGADQSARSAATVTLDASASSDPNSEVLSYAWTQLTGTTLDLSGSTSAQATFVVPAITASERVEFQVTVTDARGGVGLDQVAVDLLPPAQPCAFASTGVATAVCGSPYQYTPATQGDGPFNFALDAAPPGVDVDPATGAITWTPTSAQSGSHTLELRCVGEGGETVQQVVVNVDCTPEELTVGCGCSGTGASSPLLLALASLFAFLARSRRLRG